jgi:hypothetical protein
VSKNKIVTQTLKAMSIALFSGLLINAPAYAVDPADPVVLSFATVGDSRQDPQNVDPSLIDSSMIGVGNCQLPSGSTGLTPNPGLSGQDCKWLQNTQAWSRILRTIQAQKPNMLFFNGDMIMGYGKAGVPVTRNSTGISEAAITSPTVTDVANSDLMQFYKQYGFWRGMIANLMETGVYVVPVPGNHEVQCKRCGKKAQTENEAAWKDNMGDLILDNSRLTKLGLAVSNYNPFNNPYYDPATLATTPAPYAVNPDGISTDQSQLSYSFDVGTSHFAVINTDAVGKDGYAPSAWLENDLSAAQTKGAQHFFVFGHKPAFFYNYPGSAPSSTSSLNDKDPVAAQAFWDIIVKYKATYFCGHEHIFNVQKIPGLTQAGTAFQVLVGAGGSPFESSVPTGKASDRMYSWAKVNILQSGKVYLYSLGFDDTMSNPTTRIKNTVLLQN